MFFQQQMNRNSNTDYEDGYKGKKKYNPNREDSPLFLNYATNNPRDGNPHQFVETFGSGYSSNKRFPTEISQTSHLDLGFKKMKYNQIQAFKELKQQYEILRDLPVQDTFGRSPTQKKSSESVYESQRQINSVSSSSKPSKAQKNKKYQEQTNFRQNQLLSLQKKQLEVVVGNSMRKIEELLNNQTQYKRTIHELQKQLDSRSVDEHYENVIKNLKRTDREQTDTISSLRKDIEKYRIQAKQMEEKYDRIDKELTNKDYQIKSAYDDKKNVENLLQLEKEKRANLQIELKKTTMEKQINEKDKNNEINRLQKLMDTREPQKAREYTYVINRLEEEVRTKEKRYEYLLDEFEKYKRDISQKPPKEIVIEKNNGNEDQLRVFQRLITHLRQQNAHQNRLSADLLNNMLNKIQERNRSKQEQNHKDEDSILLNQLYTLRRELLDLKENKKQTPPLILTKENDQNYYLGKIKTLEEEIEETLRRERTISEEARRIQEAFEKSKSEYQLLSTRFLQLQERLKRNDEENSLTHENWRVKLREKQFNHDEEMRELRKMLDQAQFQVEKTKKQEEFKLSLKMAEYEEKLNKLHKQRALSLQENAELKGEIAKMKAFYEAKIKQKNELLNRAEDTQMIIKQEHEIALRTYKAANEQQLNRLVEKIESMATLNDKYIRVSQEHAQNEKQLLELKNSLKRYKFLNTNVDHLWEIKETEYKNINGLLRQMHIN